MWQNPKWNAHNFWAENVRRQTTWSSSNLHFKQMMSDNRTAFHSVKYVVRRVERSFPSDKDRKNGVAARDSYAAIFIHLVNVSNCTYAKTLTLIRIAQANCSCCLPSLFSQTNALVALISIRNIFFCIHLYALAFTHNWIEFNKNSQQKSNITAKLLRKKDKIHKRKKNRMNMTVVLVSI